MCKTTEKLIAQFLSSTKRINVINCLKCNDTGQTFVEIPSTANKQFSLIPIDCNYCSQKTKDQLTITVSKCPLNQSTSWKKITGSLPKALFIRLQKSDPTSLRFKHYPESCLILTPLVSNINFYKLESLWVHKDFETIYNDFIYDFNNLRSGKSLSKQSSILINKLGFIALDISHIKTWLELDEFIKQISRSLEDHKDCHISLVLRNNYERDMYFSSDSDPSTDEETDSEDDTSFKYSSYDSELYSSDFDPDEFN